MPKDRDDSARELYEQHDYLDAYRLHTDRRVANDAHAAVGGKWEEIGKLQLDFLVGQGLAPHHTLLDIGCGTLRAGRHFVRYLDAGKYEGFDMSEKAVAYAHELVRAENLADKRPTILVSDGHLTFSAWSGRSFDYLMAQSVFTHLMEESITECFANIGKVMTSASRWYFTFNESDEIVRTGLKDFRYPRSLFAVLAGTHGFVLTDLSAEFAHPRGQKMLRATRV